MITYRPFKNSDPPLITDLWSNAEPIKGLMQPISISVLERHVFSKPYFDRNGLILAFEDSRLIGFVHAGFGPNEDRSDLDMNVGIVCLVMVERRDDHQIIRQDLIQRAEQYLAERGATEVRAGCVQTRSPFYLGLYGGSDMAGILESDIHNSATFAELNYETDQRSRLMARQVGNYRAPVDRRQIINKRSYVANVVYDVRSRSWWEACQFGQTDRIRFFLRPRSGGPSVGEVTFWDMGMLNPTSGGQLALGLINLKIDPEHRRSGLGMFLVTDAIRQLQPTGVGTILAQATDDLDAAHPFFEKLGFDTVDWGSSLHKSL